MVEEIIIGKVTLGFYADEGVTWDLLSRQGEENLNILVVDGAPVAHLWELPDGRCSLFSKRDDGQVEFGGGMLPMGSEKIIPTGTRVHIQSTKVCFLPPGTS